MCLVRLTCITIDMEALGTFSHIVRSGDIVSDSFRFLGKTYQFVTRIRVNIASTVITANHFDIIDHTIVMLVVSNYTAANAYCSEIGDHICCTTITMGFGTHCYPI